MIRTSELRIVKRQASGRYVKAEVEFDGGLSTAEVRIVAPGPFPATFLGKPERVAEMLRQLVSELRDVLRWLENSGVISRHGAHR